jgi:hypothetical protein
MIEAEGHARSIFFYDRSSSMKTIINGLMAAVLLVSVAACASSQAQQADLTPPAKRLDAKTQLECGTKRACR